MLWWLEVDVGEIDAALDRHGLAYLYVALAVGVDFDSAIWQPSKQVVALAVGAGPREVAVVHGAGVDLHVGDGLPRFGVDYGP